MIVQVREERPVALNEYASIPIAFRVDTVLDVAEAGDVTGRFVITERSLDASYVKDYDALSGAHPTSWAERFDMSNWGLLAAYAAGRRVGGAAVVFNSPDVDMLEGRSDLAILWDIRVAPEVRGQGVGRALFQAAEEWARARGCQQLKVETQNINVPACRFYARQGCVLAAVDRHAYPAPLAEIQMLWYKALS